MMRGRKGPQGAPLTRGRERVDRSSNTAGPTALLVSVMHFASLPSTLLVCVTNECQLKVVLQGAMLHGQFERNMVKFSHPEQHCCYRYRFQLND